MYKIISLHLKTEMDAIEESKTLNINWHESRRFPIAISSKFLISKLKKHVSTMARAEPDIEIKCGCSIMTMRETYISAEARGASRVMSYGKIHK